MRSRSTKDHSRTPRSQRRCNVAGGGLVFLAGAVALSLLAAAPCHADSIPAWLDEAITKWNSANPATPISFATIKDSYVWYTIPSAPEFASKDIRARVYNIAHQNGYANRQDEEMVTTMRAPTAGGPFKTLKCYTRSFDRDPHQGSSAGTNKVLTTMVCEDGAGWSAGFRILQ